MLKVTDLSFYVGSHFATIFFKFQGFNRRINRFFFLLEDFAWGKVKFHEFPGTF